MAQPFALSTLSQFAGLSVFRSFVFLICSSCSLLLEADSPQGSTAKTDPDLQVVHLWPEGNVPGVTVSEPKQFDTPKLFLTLAQSEKPTPAIVILPGGGYWGISMDNEGLRIAAWLQSIGVSSAVCVYRVRGHSTDLFDRSIPEGQRSEPGNDGKGYGHPFPEMDAQRAVQTLRQRAKQWNIDPDRIGVMGFSAGGHLAATVSTQFAVEETEATDPVARVSSRPDFSILCYPVIGFGKPYSHSGSEKNLLGQAARAEEIAAMSAEDRVTKQTPPTFLFHTAEDKVVPVENSVQYFLACQRHGVAAELHVFPTGAHGVGIATEVRGANQWPSLCENWLRRLGILRP